MTDTKTAETPIILESFRWGKYFQPFLGMPTEGKTSQQGVASSKIPDTPNTYHVVYNKEELPGNVSGSEGGDRSRLKVIIDGPRRPALEVFARISTSPKIVYKGRPVIEDGELKFESWANRSKVPGKDRYQFGQENPFTEPSLDLDRVQIMICDLEHPAIE